MKDSYLHENDWINVGVDLGSHMVRFKLILPFFPKISSHYAVISPFITFIEHNHYYGRHLGFL